MNRVLFVFTFSTLAGIFLPNNLSVLFAVLCLLIFLQASLYIYKKKLVMIPIILGALFGFFLSEYAVPKSELLSICEKEASCVIEVASVPKETAYGVSFDGKIHSIHGKRVFEKTIVYVNGNSNLKENTLVTFKTAKFKVPEGRMNFRGFDYQRYLKSKKIFVTTNAKAENITNILPCKMNISRASLKANAFLCDTIDEKFDSTSGALLKGILLGDTSDLSAETETDFQNSGLSHVLAVSGLHLTIITMILGIFLRRLPKRLRGTLLLLSIWSFAFIVGLPVSVVRAAFMLSVLTVADCLHFENDALTNLAFVALVLMIHNPCVLYDTSFTMSFSATLGILCIMPFFERSRARYIPTMLKDCFAISFSAQIGIMPVMLLGFGRISFIGLISNILLIVLIPVIYFVVLFAFLLRLDFLFSLASVLVRALSEWAGICAKIPLGTFVVPLDSLLVAGVFGITFVFLTIQSFESLKIPAISLGVCILIVGAGYFSGIAPPKNTQITFINVGQADCTMLRTKTGETFLVDVGTVTSASNEVVPYLRREGVKNIDGVFLSHFDDDHCGGIEVVAENIGIEVLYIPDTIDVGARQYEILKYTQENKIRVVPLRAGDIIRASAVSFTALHPDGTMPDNHNASSLAVRADGSDFSAIFPGDLEKDNVLQNCDADILKVTHHGSAKGSTQAFIDSCTPEIAVISLAKNNSYGFPRAEVLERIGKHTNHVFRTDLNGTIEISCDNFKYQVRTLR